MEISILFLGFAIILKFFPPKKPNFYYGYQLGSAKKSIEHWKLSNKYAANYMIIFYSILIIMIKLFDYLEYDGWIIFMSTAIIGALIIYFAIERKLKRKIS
jgi:uncharacterized membrane protein